MREALRLQVFSPEARPPQALPFGGVLALRRPRAPARAQTPPPLRFGCAAGPPTLFRGALSICHGPQMT